MVIADSHAFDVAVDDVMEWLGFNPKADDDAIVNYLSALETEKADIFKRAK